MYTSMHMHACVHACMHVCISYFELLRVCLRSSYMAAWSLTIGVQAVIMNDFYVEFEGLHPTKTRYWAFVWMAGYFHSEGVEGPFPTYTQVAHAFRSVRACYMRCMLVMSCVDFPLEEGGMMTEQGRASKPCCTNAAGDGAGL